MKLGTPGYNHLGWYDGYNDNVKSIGPCYPNCHVEYVEKSNETVSVVLYSHEHLSGKVERVQR